MSNPRSFLNRLNIPYDVIHNFHKNLKLPHDVGLFCVGARTNALDSLASGRFAIGLNEDRSLIHILVPSGSYYKRKTYKDGQFTYNTISRVSDALKESTGKGLTWYVSMKRFNPNRDRLYHSEYREEDYTALEDKFDRIYGKKFKETALRYAEKVEQAHQEIIDNHISQIEINDQNVYNRHVEHLNNLKLYHSRFKSIAELGASSMGVSSSLMYRTEIVTMFAQHLRSQTERTSSWNYRYTLANDYRIVKTFIEEDKLYLPKYAKFLFDRLRKEKEYIMQ